MFKSPIFLIWCLLSDIVFSQFSDYFSEDFDVNKNCKQQDLIQTLVKENKGRCAVIMSGNNLENKISNQHSVIYPGSDELQWEQCKMRLSKALTTKCHGLGIVKVDIVITYKY